MGKENRRNFIKKMAAAASVAAIGSKSGLAMGEQTQQEPSVKNIEALGFQWKTMDPFLFCVHHEDFFPKGNKEMGPDKSLLAGRNIGQDFLIKDGFRMYHGDTVPGFPGHPHRGFETVTVVRTGMVDHTDSMGGKGRYGNGDVQWMTAGKGIQHAEMFPLIHQDKDNPMELFQIWLNLPRKSKFVEPHYKMLWDEEIPIYQTNNESGKNIRIEVIAGKLGQHKSPSPPPNSWAYPAENEVAIWNIKMDAGAKWKIPTASVGVNRTIYFYKGDALTVDGQAIPTYHMAQLKVDEELVFEAGMEDAHVLVLQGKPINEPVVQHGPFVMNTREEIQQAFADYQRTRFGGWPWPQNDPVHPADQGRFAYHADGTMEDKS